MALKPNLRRFAATTPLVLIAVGVWASVAVAGPFQSPSGNIGCYALKDAVRCDIRHRAWKPPPKPARCPLDWGQGVSVGAKGRAHIVCAGDTTLGAGRKLPYGHSIAKGPFRCVSMRSGMRCVNRRSGHGFFLSRQRYRLF